MSARAVAGVGSASMKKSKPEPIPVMDYRQYRRARRLVHECCNYDGGNCIALDDGEECVCVQSISYSLLCRWFRAAVLPLDKELETALFHRLEAKRCAVCGALFTPGSNRAKYCPECAGRMKRIKAAQRKRKQRAKCHALVRGFSTSLSHGMCTLLVGYGMQFLKLQKKLFYTGIFGLLSLAMTFHAVFNLLIQSPYDWLGMLLPIVTYLGFRVFTAKQHKKERAAV